MIYLDYAAFAIFFLSIATVIVLAVVGLILLLRNIWKAGQRLLAIVLTCILLFLVAAGYLDWRGLLFF